MRLWNLNHYTNATRFLHSVDLDEMREAIVPEQAEKPEARIVQKPKVVAKDAQIQAA